MNNSKLKSIAKKLVAPKKSILAADESTGTIEKRLNQIKVKSTEKSRRDYRELLFTSKGIEKYISGIILYDETLRQKASDGTSFVKLLEGKGIVPGIKVDKGAKDLAAFPGEKVTEGLDGLRERFEEYAKIGAGFSKWRAVITIGKNIPTEACIHANAHALARYAALSQEAGIVPIVEPEVLMNGDHSIKRCAEVTGRTLDAVFTELARYEVFLEGMLLKPNMIISGSEAKKQSSVREVVETTLKVFREFVPKRVPGIVFLSGGLSPDEATERLNAINKMGKQPWELSYSFGRALQQEALLTWEGKEAKKKEAQEVFIKRASLTSTSRSGSL